jgi:hypothetical protein
LGECQVKLGFNTTARSSLERCLELCARHEGALRELSEMGGPQWSLRKIWDRFTSR